MLFGLMLTAATCCGQNANTGTPPGTLEAIPLVQYLSADSNKIQLEQQAHGDTNVVFAVVDPLTMPVINDSQGNSYGLLSANWLLFAFLINNGHQGRSEHHNRAERASHLRC